MSQKTRINLYLSPSVGESFKRYCKSRKKPYSEIIEALIYRFLITPKSNNETSGLDAMQNEIHDQAVNAYRNVYESHRRDIIDSAIESSGSGQVNDVSPQIPMPMESYPPQGGVKRGISTNHLSKRNRG